MTEKKVILISGASSGFGKASAEFLSRKGHIVYGTSRKSGLHCEGYNMIQMDVNLNESVKNAINHVISKEGRIDVLINNAGYAIAGSVEDTDISEIKDQFETNFFGVFRMCSSVLSFMREKKSGLIINISSIAGIIGTPYQSAYSASKFALEGFTETLRMEVKQFGIHTVLIEPGDFKTKITENRIYTENSRKSEHYSKAFSKALTIMEKEEKRGPDPQIVALLINKIINTNNPRLRYTTGPILEKFAVFLKKILHASLFEWLIMGNYNLRN